MRKMNGNISGSNDGMQILFFFRSKKETIDPRVFLGEGRKIRKMSSGKY